MRKMLSRYPGSQRQGWCSKAGDIVDVRIAVENKGGSTKILPEYSFEPVEEVTKSFNIDIKSRTYVEVIHIDKIIRQLRTLMQNKVYIN